MTFYSDLYFFDASSPVMEELIFFHEHAVIVILVILVMISQLFISLFLNKNFCVTFLEGQKIEIFWTFLPIFFLLIIGVPSLRLLYLMEESYSPDFSMKVMGHQWYWSYEYSDFLKSFDSFMISSESITKGMFRLLEVDNRAMLPKSFLVRILVSSSDVIHSWTVPSFGVKTDAIPGRLNQLNVFPTRLGVFYGQCSEICGANHSFMPIVVEVNILPDFLKWVSS